jgi:hypothetical protein
MVGQHRAGKICPETLALKPVVILGSHAILAVRWDVPLRHAGIDPAKCRLLNPRP